MASNPKPDNAPQPDLFFGKMNGIPKYSLTTVNDLKNILGIIRCIFDCVVNAMRDRKSIIIYLAISATSLRVQILIAGKFFGNSSVCVTFEFIKFDTVNATKCDGIFGGSLKSALM